LLLIRGILAALRQKIHLMTCPNSPGHLSDEWLVEKHGTKTRRSWRKLHIGLDADTG